MRAELLRAEAGHFAKKRSGRDSDAGSIAADSVKALPSSDTDVEMDAHAEEDPDAKRRRLILEEARDIDADSVGSDSESSEEEYALCWSGST